MGGEIGGGIAVRCVSRTQFKHNAKNGALYAPYILIIVILLTFGENTLVFVLYFYNFLQIYVKKIVDLGFLNF